MSEQILVSTVTSATDTATRDYDASTVIDAIRSGGKKLRGQIEQIRNRLEAELVIPAGNLKAAKKAIGEFKLKLPGVLWSGTFTKRENDALVQHSGLLCADLDGLNSSLADIRQKLKDSPNLWALFISPSGDGLKAVFKVPADAAKHPGSFRAVEQQVRELTGAEVDQACKDVARLCFLSYDPELYHNPNAQEIAPLPEPEKPRPINNGMVNLSERQRIATELLGTIDWQSEASGFVTCPGKHLHTRRDHARDCKIELDNVPTAHCFHNSCRGILENVNHELRSRIGKIEYKPLANEQKEGTPAESSLNSLPRNGNSGGVIQEFPEPLSDAAFQGLAGDIVRRIEPHTEASPVALLIQTLTAFGSVIGRNAHSIADGSRHGANLFAVLVGESSKSRKGTSWQHVLRIFERADEDWKKNCVANGLSSGEGVIWAVRDPITKTVPKKEKGKFTGGHETVIADAGVDDKRLCVSEGEFANVLKVMAREGNTLSPVIRSAWDSDNLRTMTKNSEARATGAHISIIGHITRDELRRLLSETESANGFGNRFLWLAVRRSKCLPEGGNIDSEALNDLVVRLHKAIEFGRFAGEVARSSSARELWRRVYPELSEGLPGLLGALTARGEAQVLRLSAIYALLDCSTKIEVKHQQAALALWNYCERSAGWIFSTATGDTRSDRLLVALREAGTNGLTRTQILEDVCQRNLSASDLSNVLQSLRRAGLAYCRDEATSTKPRERWFAFGRRLRGYEVYEVSQPIKGNNSYNSYNSLALLPKNTPNGEPSKESVQAAPAAEKAVKVLRI